MSRLQGFPVKRQRILDWVEDRYLPPISVAAKENWVVTANFNMQLHGDLVSFMEECTEG